MVKDRHNGYGLRPRDGALPKDSAGMFRHILLPVDDDPGSRHAIELGVALARRAGARVTGFHAMTDFAQPDGRGSAPGPSIELQARMCTHADRLFAPLRREAIDAGVPCTTLAERGGQPCEAIVAAARNAGCDLIVMASHGRRGKARAMLGSQTQQVLDRAGIPVLVVR